MILRDTHALLWMACAPKRVSRRADEAIRNARQGTGSRSRSSRDGRSRGWRITSASWSQGAWNRSCARPRVILKPVTAEIAALTLRLPEPSQRSGRPHDRFDGHGRGHATGDRGMRGFGSPRCWIRSVRRRRAEGGRPRIFFLLSQHFPMVSPRSSCRAGGAHRLGYNVL